MFERPVHPGVILGDAIREHRISQSASDRRPASRVGQIIAGKRCITGDTASVADCQEGLSRPTPSRRLNGLLWAVRLPTRSIAAV